MSPERRAKGGLGCPVSHPEHGDTLKGHQFATTKNPVNPVPFVSEMRLRLKPIRREFFVPCTNLTHL
ncbi:MAG: hypothetical protein [Olavius algarvensis Gamma 1 endosymbiont]|nr:MAG: hypothetical protein [Olavius algarvensis Gamma 1 endosymbiont]